MKDRINDDFRKPDIAERTYTFALRILRVVRALPRDVVGQIMARQLARAGMSVGANVEEAQGAHSRADFARRMNIARTEAREALYWLRLAADSGLLSRKQLHSILDEADQLVRILVTIVRNAKK